MARLLDVSTRTVERWERAAHRPTSLVALQRLAALEQIADLGHQVYTREGFEEFLSTPLPVFEGRTALQTLSRGRADLVLAALAADYEGLGF